MKYVIIIGEELRAQLMLQWILEDWYKGLMRLHACRGIEDRSDEVPVGLLAAACKIYPASRGRESLVVKRAKKEAADGKR